MDHELRADMDKLHGRITIMSERLARVEAQEPHINKALVRIEMSVQQVQGHMSKGVWIILALFLTAVFSLIRTGSIPI